MRGQRGFSLVELSVVLAIFTLVTTGVGGTVFFLQRVPPDQIARLQLQEELRSATMWVRFDANKAQSFQPGAGAEYGTFRWVDFSTFPATRRKVVYFTQEGDVANPSATTAPFNYLILYRQPYTEGVAGSVIPLMRHIATASDVVFSVASNPHFANFTAIERVLSVDVTGTIEGGPRQTLRETATVKVDLRPEQLNPVEFQFFFLHNNPTPPTANTNSQATLPMDFTQPTATTLFNYDVDRDALPGLKLVGGPARGRLDSPNPANHQDWLSGALAQGIVIDGRVSLYINVAAGGFQTGLLLMLHAWLRDFDPVTGTYTLITKEEAALFTSTAGWVQLSFHFRPTLYTLPQGHKLTLQIQFDGQSDTLLDVVGMVAYDTTAQLSFLSVPTQP